MAKRIRKPVLSPELKLTKREGMKPYPLPVKASWGKNTGQKSNWSYMSFPACSVYMLGGDITTLVGQGNVFFEIMFDPYHGLGFKDTVNSGVFFYIGFPTLMELRGFLETLGMLLEVETPYPPSYTIYKQELDEMRALAKFSMKKRRSDEAVTSPLWKRSAEARRRYKTLMQYKLTYDANNRALKDYALVLRGEKDITELAFSDPPI